jgi:hypothetical protein
MTIYFVLTKELPLAVMAILSNDIQTVIVHAAEESGCREVGRLSVVNDMLFGLMVG